MVGVRIHVQRAIATPGAQLIKPFDGRDDRRLAVFGSQRPQLRYVAGGQHYPRYCDQSTSSLLSSAIPFHGASMEVKTHCDAADSFISVFRRNGRCID